MTSHNTGTPQTELNLLQNYFQDGQGNNAITAQDMRDFVASVAPERFPTSAAQFQSLVTQTAPDTNPLVVALEVEHYSENITHSTVTLNSEVEIITGGIYEISVGISILQTGGGGGGIVSVWLQEDIGAGFVDTTGAVRRDGSSNSAGFASLGHLDRHVAGDKYRVMWATDNTNAALTAFMPGVGTHPANHPAIPSIDFRIKRVGHL